MRWTSIVARVRFCGAWLLLLGSVLAPAAARAQTVPAGQGLVADTTELRVLRQLYAATGGPGWTAGARPNWLQGTTLAAAAAWGGVTVAGGDVTGLYMDGGNAQGTLPASLGLLVGLTKLQFSTLPALTGPIPRALGGLANLQSLIFSSTGVSGPIPAELGQLANLTYLSCFNNYLSGPLPPELGNLTKLTEAYLGNSYRRPLGTGNQYSGGPPAAFGRLTGLRALDVSQCALTGPVPAELGNLVNLTSLDLDANQLSGPVPAALANLRQLAYLNLAGNRLTGAPGWRGVAAPAGLQLDLSANTLDFGALERDFTGAGLHPFRSFAYAPQAAPAGTDTVRYPLGRALALRRGLGGARTRYQWQRRQAGQWQDVAGARDSVLTVATASAADSGAYRVRATNDWATGLTLTSKPVYARPADPRVQALRDFYEATDGDHWNHHEHWPSGEAAWSAVRAVRQCVGWYGLDVRRDSARGIALGTNHMHGRLPASLAQLRELEYFDVNNNQFQDSVPAVLGRLPRLVKLRLNDNLFTGPLPASLGQLARLQNLYLHNNQFAGPFPAVVLRCAALTKLYLDNNRFAGALPAALGQLAQLAELGLARNQFTGAVPAGLPQRPLIALYLNGNAFTDLPGWAGAARVPANFFVNDNLLDFAALEANFTGASLPVPGFTYAPQGSPAGTDTVAYTVGDGLQLTRAPRGAHNAYQWEHQAGGAWQTVAGQTAPSLRLAAAGAADAGPYRLRVTNAWVPNVTLYARAFYARAGVPPALTNPPVACVGAALAGAPPPVVAPAGDQNYVRTYTARVALTDAARVPGARVDSVSTGTQYLDGLGRPVQTVAQRASPAGRDLVTPVAYDALGRQAKDYLPYAATSPPDAGGYRANALREQDDFYRLSPPGPGVASANVARTGVAYSEQVFEASPLNRVRQRAAPGEPWALAGGHPAGRAERPNTDADAVARFAAAYGAAAAAANVLAYQGVYAAGELWAVQTTDEQGQATQEFTDKQGQVVAKKVALAADQWLTTYYVYDDFPRLRAVLPPQATTLLLGNGQQVSAAVDSLLFHYRYDGRGRMLAKQVPGQAGEVQTVFDRLDRPVLTQDPAQRARQEWAWAKYDALGRAVLTGLVTRAATADALQAEADALGTAPAGQVPAAAPFEQPTTAAATQYYSVTQAYPRLGLDGFGPGQVLTAAYYDGYDFNGDGTADLPFDNQYAAQFPAGQAPAADARVTGLATRTRTRVLGTAAADPGAWLTATTFYDDRGRPVQVQSTNARGAPDVVTRQLDFVGQVLKTYSVHAGYLVPGRDPTHPNHEDIRVAETFAYDPAGRLLTGRQQVGAEAQPVTVASNAYNEVGQLVQKMLAPNTPLQQQVDYTYNIRGWLTGLNADLVTGTTPAAASQDLWGMTLSYDCGFQVPQYNGNISGQQWRGKRDGVARAYGYGYDGANRLLFGDYVAQTAAGAWSAEPQRYGLQGVRYDANGNLLALQRRGLLANATRAVAKQYGPVDNLAYAYAGNRLRAVNDGVRGNQLPRPAGYRGAPASLAGDFQEQGVRQAQEYAYDPNGSLTSDANKGITRILYNHLNLPRQVQFGTGADSVVFRYTAAGQKVAKLVYQTGKPVVRTDYLGPYQYEGDSLRFFPHAEGRVLRFVSAVSGQVRYEREYTLQDHLGNLRLAYRAGHRTTCIATLEPDDPTRKREVRQFDSLSVSPPIAQYVGNMGGVNRARTGTYVARLNAGGAAPQPLGPLKQLAVQKGDTVTVTAPGYYPQAVQSASFAFSLASFVASLVQAQPAPAPGTDGSRRGALPLLSIGVSAALPALIKPSGGVPLGYARLLVFDADSNLVSQQVQTRQLSAAAASGYEPLTVQVIAQQDGYVTAYVGNESNADVYFDDVTVTLGQGLQVQETAYDPAGLELAGLAPPSPGIRGLNNYRFNGKEFQADLGLNWNHQDWRFLDPQLLRWHAVDPEIENGQESWTPYAFGFDNAVRYADADGRFPILAIAIGVAVGAGIEYGVEVATNLVESRGHIYGSTFTEGAVDGKKIALAGVAGGIGALTGAVFAQAATGATRIAAASRLAMSSGTAAKVISGSIKVASELTGDAVSSVVGNTIQGKEVTVGGTALDVAGGLVGRRFQGAAQADPKGQILKRAADRAGNIASGANGRANRQTAMKAAQAAYDGYGAISSALASGGTSAVVSPILDYADKKRKSK